MKYSAEKLESGLAKIESYYLGDGWYQDGGSCQKDYYISFALDVYKRQPSASSRQIHPAPDGPSEILL